MLFLEAVPGTNPKRRSYALETISPRRQSTRFHDLTAFCSFRTTLRIDPRSPNDG